MTISAHHAFGEVWKQENRGPTSCAETWCTYGNC